MFRCRLGLNLVLPGLVVSVLLLAGVSGCQKQGTPSGAGGEATTLQPAEDLYRAGRYREARARAEIDCRRSSGLARRRAALTAGLAAHALGDSTDARGWLEPLLADEDPAIAGRASAAVGMMADQQGDHGRAAELLSSAASKLNGDDSARAALRAGHAYSALGRLSEASASYQSALATATSPALQAAIRPYTEPGPFALQVGLFTSRPNAEQRAAELRGTTARFGWSPPRVASVVASGGKPGYSVRVGSFASRHAAVVAGERLGTPSIVVAAR